MIDDNFLVYELNRKEYFLQLQLSNYDRIDKVILSVN